MTIEETLARFAASREKRQAYYHALAILNYDAETTLPAEGAEAYANTVRILSEEAYHLLVNDELRQVLADMLAHKAEIPYYLFREAEELTIHLQKMAVIPAEEYGTFQNDIAIAGNVWRKAKQAADYALFAPHLRLLAEKTARFAALYDSSRPLYEVILQDYEKGLSLAELDQFFVEIRQELVPLIHSIASKPQPDTSFLRGEFPLPQQKELAEYLMQIMTVDRNRCALGETEHPFTTETNNHDVRVTTHYFAGDVLSSMYSVIHENGHALYMMHEADELNGTLLMEGASFAIHEAIARLFENLIGRSLPFLTFLLPKMQILFPEVFANVTPQAFYSACNRVQPSLIRTDADELTYSLHILIRYELEKLLFSGELDSKDLPARWNQLYQEYLGVAVPNDAEGVLQDMHWSDAGFGYFPTYALGSAYGAQILAAMEKEIDVWALVQRGEFTPIVQWLTEKLFRFGGIKTPAELIQDICGEPFSARYYTEYLKQKYCALYALSPIA